MAIASYDTGNLPASGDSEGRPGSPEPLSGQPLSYKDAVVFLDTIPGVNQRTAEIIVAE